MLQGCYDCLLDYPEALRFYDRTVAAEPAHNLALLGRIICLTNLARAQEAIDAATQLLELGAGNQADAHYWRAHNHRSLARLTEARKDTSAAKELRLRALQARGDLDPVYRANAVASFEASIEADTRQQHLAALIAASHVATGGDLASAKTLVELAAQDPALADRVAKLREQLGRLR